MRIEGSCEDICPASRVFGEQVPHVRGVTVVLEDVIGQHAALLPGPKPVGEPLAAELGIDEQAHDRILRTGRRVGTLDQWTPTEEWRRGSGEDGRMAREGPPAANLIGPMG